MGFEFDSVVRNTKPMWSEPKTMCGKDISMTDQLNIKYIHLLLVYTATPIVAMIKLNIRTFIFLACWVYSQKNNKLKYFDLEGEQKNQTNPLNHSIIPLSKMCSMRDVCGESLSALHSPNHHRELNNGESTFGLHLGRRDARRLKKIEWLDTHTFFSNTGVIYWAHRWKQNQHIGIFRINPNTNTYLKTPASWNMLVALPA